MTKPLSTRIAIRRWAALQCRTEIAYLTAHVAAEPFDLVAMVSSCLRLAGAGAAALAEESDDEIIHSAYFSTEGFHLQLFEGERDDAADFATGFARALIAYIEYAQSSLKVCIPFAFIDCITQLLERSVVTYLSADPDVNWNILVRQCWALYDAVAAHKQPGEIEEIVEQIEREIGRIPLPSADRNTMIDYDAIAERHAPIDPTLLGPVEPGYEYVPFDEGPRFHRLAQRHDAMVAAGIPDPDEYRRVHAELYHLTTDEYRVDPRRLYGDGPYPWEQTDAVPAGATSTA
jgi:hypothetical protein